MFILFHKRKGILLLPIYGIKFPNNIIGFSTTDANESSFRETENIIIIYFYWVH